MHIFKLDQMGTNPKKHWEVENAQCLDCSLWTLPPFQQLKHEEFILWVELKKYLLLLWPSEPLPTE